MDQTVHKMHETEVRPDKDGKLLGKLLHLRGREIIRVRKKSLRRLYRKKEKIREKNIKEKTSERAKRYLLELTKVTGDCSEAVSVKREKKAILQFKKSK